MIGNGAYVEGHVGARRDDVYLRLAALRAEQDGRGDARVAEERVLAYVKEWVPEPKKAPLKKPPPKPIAGLGDEAFWVGDPLSGALYVLKGEIFLRVSVGGPTDEAQKIKRARALASRALKRLTARPRS